MMSDIFRALTIILLLILSVSCPLFAHSASSLALAGSYSLRATGSEANYWNPANLALARPYQVEITLLNSYLRLNNNAISIGEYNDYNGSYLTDSDKQLIVDRLGKNFSLQSMLAHNLSGISLRNLAFSARLNIFAEGNLSAKYMELLLFGNEYDRVYTFSKKKNNLEALGYTDFTIGFSPYSFQLGDYQIHTGLALSFLAGLGVLTTEYYQGILSVTDDGINLRQDITMKSGLNGLGLKSLIGLRTDLTEQLTVGLSVDNIGGFIYWIGDTERRIYSASIDSLFLADLDEDIFLRSEVVEKIGNFTTALPVYTRLAALYRLENINFSLDWKQGYVNNVLTSKTPEIAMGTEYYLTGQIPLRLGFSPGLGKNRFQLSYGSGYVTNRFEINLGIKSIGYVIPTTYSRGLAVAITSKWRF